MNRESFIFTSRREKKGLAYQERAPSIVYEDTSQRGKRRVTPGNIESVTISAKKFSETGTRIHAVEPDKSMRRGLALSFFVPGLFLLTAGILDTTQLPVFLIGGMTGGAFMCFGLGVFGGEGKLSTALMPVAVTQVALALLGLSSLPCLAGGLVAFGALYMGSLIGRKMRKKYEVM